MEDQTLEEFENNCITNIRKCCRKDGYYRKQTFTEI